MKIKSTSEGVFIHVEPKVYGKEDVMALCNLLQTKMREVDRKKEVLDVLKYYSDLKAVYPEMNIKGIEKHNFYSVREVTDKWIENYYQRID